MVLWSGYAVHRASPVVRRVRAPLGRSMQEFRRHARTADAIGPAASRARAAVVRRPIRPEASSDRRPVPLFGPTTGHATLATCVSTCREPGPRWPFCSLAASSPWRFSCSLDVRRSLESPRAAAKASIQPLRRPLPPWLRRQGLRPRQQPSRRPPRASSPRSPMTSTATNWTRLVGRLMGNGAAAAFPLNPTISRERP